MSDDRVHRMFGLTVANCIRSLSTRIVKINVSLESLKDKHSAYANAHRALLAAHDEARAVYRKHLKAMTNTSDGKDGVG